LQSRKEEENANTEASAPRRGSEQTNAQFNTDKEEAMDKTDGGFDAAKFAQHFNQFSPLARHPFGKVPVLDYDGARILETSAIVRFLNDVLPGPSLIPPTPRDRARMDMVIGTIDSYGYAALLGGVAAYHLFPDFVGGQHDAARKAGIDNGRKVLELAMRTKGVSTFIAGDLSLADLYLAPITFYVSMTPDKDTVFDIPGFADWWSKVQALPSYKSTQPNFG
jgi:glutathione S-transferase